jgi:serine/threonine protein kinase
MNSHQSTVRCASAPTIGDGGQSGCRPAEIAAIEDFWSKQSDEMVLRTIDAFPALATDKSLLLDLVLKEYKLRGEQRPVSRDEFCEQFHCLGESMERSIVRALEVQAYLDEHRELLGLITDFEWPKPGDNLQGFQVVEELGRGALARAYLCRESDLGQRNVVLKIARGSGYEADFLGRLDHPNIVPIYSVRNEANQAVSCICMPFRGRSTLQDLVDHVRKHGIPKCASAITEIALLALPPIERQECVQSLQSARRWRLDFSGYVDGVLQIAIQLADALAHSHEVGVYHGDLKPSNVLLTPDGRPLLIDFNLAADRDSGASPLGGTLAYMPPEQLVAVGSDCHSGQFRYDARSEVYSFGTFVFELLTGTPPFPIDATSSSPKVVAREMLRQQRNSMPRIRDVNPHVNIQLEQLVSQCLAIDPNDRPKSMLELRRRLKLQSAFPARLQRYSDSRPTFTKVLLIVSALMAVGCALYFLLRPPLHARQLASGIALRQANDFESAVANFDNAMKHESQRHNALYERAHTYLKQGKLSDAMSDFAAVWKEYADPRAAAWVGYCFNRQGNPSLAIPWYENALKCGFETVGLYNNLGMSYAMGHSAAGPGSQFSLAHAHLQKALARNPSSRIVRSNLVTLVLMHPEHCTGPKLRQATSHLEFLQSATPRNQRLMADSVQLYGLLSLTDESFVDRAIEAIELSLESGNGPTARELSASPRFDRLRHDSRFSTLQSSAPTAIAFTERADLGMFIVPVPSDEK